MDTPRVGTALIETMRTDGSEVALLSRHMARLVRSARSLEYQVDLAEIEEQVGRAAAFGEPARLRLLLWRDGTHEVTVSPLAPEVWQTVAVYPEPIEEAGTWRCTCKTTARSHYDRAVAWASRVGVDEPILINARGEVMEGARTNVFVQLEDRMLTPPLASGGLDGVMRQVMIEQGAEERVLAPEALHGAGAILLTNAVRGLLSVNLVTPPA